MRIIDAFGRRFISGSVAASPLTIPETPSSESPQVRQ
jgi:hypothetical protein